MFDPTEFTVKDARKKLDGLSLENLAAVLKLESDNKNRSSLVEEIERAIEAAKEGSSDDDEPMVEALAPTIPEYETITLEQYFGLKRQQKRMWERAADGSFRRLR
tara:strand:- start:451 stop:765 length:315 start_codon:yes stop_codon:yes gene_type:complete